ncbi:MAG: hypothetical protein HDR09_19215 [Lachnospiraceae bacterium]|nr:hypothetical protein [Lachnospiraceae bacterium]
MENHEMTKFLLSDDFCRQFEREWKKYNSDVNNALELVRIIEDNEKERLSKGEEPYDAVMTFI